MKNTIMVLILMLLGMPVFAQQDAVKITILQDDNSDAYPRLINFLRAEKNYRGLLHSNNNKLWTSKRFTDLFNTPDKSKEATTGRHTFMDGPAVYPTALPLEISRNANSLYQRYSAGIQQPSEATTALQILGIIGGIAATASLPKKYLGFKNESAVSDYLQSTYFQQHNK